VVFAGAAAARHRLDDLDLFSVVVDEMADVNDALEAGMGVIMLLGGWVRGLRCRLTLAAHGATPPE
jgi:hypothetical protein